jgi:serine phosphatase RsbU (regulator of sigma subunit)/PAS domain-containing protein/anti-sigma regulatory factor (Ser/Thr protein kinase)
LSATPDPGDLDGPPRGATVVLLLGAGGEVRGATRGAERLTGRSAAQLHGSRLADLLAEPAGWPDLDELAGLGEPGHGTVALRRPDGGTREVRLDVFPLLPHSGHRQLVALTPQPEARRGEEDEAMLRALFAQNRVGLALHDADLCISRLNADPSAVIRGGPGPQDGPIRVHDLLMPEDADALMEQLRRVAATGEPLVYWEHTARLTAAPGQERVLAVSALQLQDPDERLIGVLSVFTDNTEQHLARRRMALLHTAAQRIGPTLDVSRNVEELTRVLVPDFADLAAVDLSEAVLTGDEPGGAVLRGAPMRRCAATSADSGWPPETHPLGAAFRLEHVTEGRRPADTVLREAEVSALRPRPLEDAPADPGGPTQLLPTAPGSRMLLPLRARGQILGTLALWRAAARPPFSRSDVDLAEEIGSRAALSVDNARRYTREHRTLETLQRSLLPQPVFEVSAARTAGNYVPARTAAGIGGGWYDVIPLSSARVAFVIGDIAGHGLGATATMGRLRTAVQTLADLDLAPDELLTRLDDLAIRLADVEPHQQGDRRGAVGATCLYCVYDPVTGHCVMAGAGRVPPVVARPGEPVTEVPLKSGPPLGVGGSPFESVSIRVDPGSLLLFFSDGLVAHADENDHDLRGERVGVLHDRVAAGLAAGHSPAAVGQAVLDALLPGRAPANDVALLVARVRTLPEGSTADWQFPAEPAIVAEARDAVLGRLKDWNLSGNTFPTELIVSELLTNAIRYAGGPIGLRLIRDETLICEVSDPSETQPHLRRARETDEGGRGLFLVAQLAHRWGSRYTASGKTIWTEQQLDQG